MDTNYKIGDKVLLQGTIEKIEVIRDGRALYYFQEQRPTGLPVLDDHIVGKVKDFAPKAKATISRANMMVEAAIGVISGIMGAGIGILVWKLFIQG